MAAFRRLLLRLRARAVALMPPAARGRRSPSLPALPTDPHPGALPRLPGEQELPETIRDEQILRRALEWRDKAGDAAVEAPPLLPVPARRIANVLLVSHCDFTGNSAYHVHAIAAELHRRGLSMAVAIPGGTYTVEEIGRVPFPVLTYRQVRRGKLRFPDGRGPDLVHAFTPRERVRRLTVDVVAAHECPYVVHLEDNEQALLSAALGGIDVERLRELPYPLLEGVIQDRHTHPQLGRQFLEHAVGASVVIDALQELVPDRLPTQVIRAGFDEAVLTPRRPREEVRSELELDPDDLAIFYPGNVHAANVEELRSLWRAVAILQSRGRRAVLVKTGWSAAEVGGFPSLGGGIRDLGWVARTRIPELLAAADVLVQPGAPGLFNDYRLPSKLPEFLASGRPVVLPRTNVGLLVEDGVHALLLERGDADEIAAAVERLLADPALRLRLGDEGRTFAVRELNWSRAVDRVQELYATIAGSGRPAVPARAIATPDPPVKLVAIVDRAPTSEESRTARAHGVFDFRVVNGVETSRLSASDQKTMEERLGGDPLHETSRTLPLPAGDDRDRYEMWLRKLVLQAIILGRESTVLLDARPGGELWRRQWLERTLSALVTGTVQAYASRRISLSRRDAERMFRFRSQV